MRLTESDWTSAMEHFDRVTLRYIDRVQRKGACAAISVIDYVLNPLLRRYNAGERTQRLYEEIAGVE